MTNVKHTPTPWEARTSENNPDFFGDVEGWAIVSICDGPDNPEHVMGEDNDSPVDIPCDADLAFAVRAVNCHDELVAACRAALDCWNANGLACVDDNPGMMMLNALAHAEEKA